MLRSIKIALSFLTVWRVQVHPVPNMDEVGRCSWAFPVVGMMMGAVLVVAQWILAGHASPVLGAVLVVGLWVFLTGGLHLDGWTDCWDALPVAVSPERRRDILKDSRLGTFGALGLILLLAVKMAAVAAANERAFALFLAPVAGRGIMVLVCYGATYTSGGMAGGFLSGLDEKTVRLTALVGLGPALLLGVSGIVAVAGACVAALCFRRFAESRLEVINGDVIGALCEFSEAIFLVIATMK
jgi:adenosylcobinamide-GDP ribazoletransferase